MIGNCWNLSCVVAETSPVAEEPWRPPDDMANLGPIGSGQPPAILLASWDPLAPPPEPIHTPHTRWQSQARRRRRPPPQKHHGRVISSRRPWARVRRQFRPRVRRLCRAFFVLGKSAKNHMTRRIQSIISTSWNVRRRG